MNTLSRLYVNPNGELMCGEPGKQSSRVEGLKREYTDIDDPEKFDYHIVFKNKTGVKCHGYMFTCKMRWWMYNENQSEGGKI